MQQRAVGIPPSAKKDPTFTISGDGESVRSDSQWQPFMSPPHVFKIKFSEI
jgi:hypothetical protein